jgi:hypothetical protein
MILPTTYKVASSLILGFLFLSSCGDTYYRVEDFNSVKKLIHIRTPMLKAPRWLNRLKLIILYC